MVYLLQLLHQSLVDLKAPGGVQNQNVNPRFAGFLLGFFGDPDRIGLAKGEELDSDLASQRFQLIDGRGAIDVKGGEHDFLVELVLQAVVVLPVPCKPTNMMVVRVAL